MKRNSVLVVLIIIFVGLGCSLLSKKDVTAPPATPPATPVESPSATPTPAPTAEASNSPAPAREPNLLSFANGALIVQKPTEYGGWAALQMFDDSENSGWATEKGKISDQVTVIELPARTTFTAFNFDTAQVDSEGSAAKDITVEISDTSAASGFQNILTASLEDKKDGQNFKATSSIPGRWVRLTAKNNHGSKDYTEIMEFHGTGTQEPAPPLENISGTYETNFGNFHVKQEGTSVIGCYEHNLGLLEGGIENRIMKLTWSENEKHDSKGPAIMIFSTDGKTMTGMWQYQGDTRFAGEWNGKKKSSEVGSCPHLPNLSKGNATQTNIEKNIEETGRARIYGINFDTNSDVIREESKSTLNQIAAVLKEKSDWKMMIEGHTDNIGGESSNQTLSEKRAKAVKDFLVKAGIDDSRLNTVGYGLSKPVAPNESETGRAQNRRVELVKQ